MVNKILTTLYIIITLSMPSCIENMDTPDFSENTDGFVRFTVNIPSAAIPRENTLRSRQITAETQINEIQVLVFENGLYSYKATGGDINQTDGVASFSARIRSNNVPTTIYIVANNNAVVDANEPAIDSSIDDVNTLFNLPYTSAGTSGNVALWGSYRWENGVDATIDNIVTPISLLRAMARVDVQVAPTASTNFTLQSVQVFRAANTIQIIPNSPNTELSVTTPSIPEGIEFDVNTNPVTSISATLSEAQVYIPESSAPPQADQVSQATCIVVGGRFNNSATTRFYRLDFNPLIEGHPLGQILRNCRYHFTISEVESDGYDTPLQAANNTSSGMDVSLVFWPSGNINYMFFDNNNFFGIEQNIIHLQGVINSSIEAAVSTDADSYQLRFLDGQPTPWSTSLNDGVFSVTQINGGTSLLFTTLSNHFLSTPRQRTVQIRSGTVDNIIITLIQEPTEYNGQWSLVNVDAPGTFANNLNSFGMLYVWNNNTAYPNSGTVANWTTGISVSFSWSAQLDPCPQGWRIPTVAEFNQLINDYRGFRVYTGTDSANPNQGLWIAPTQAEANSATFQNPDNALFFPFSGTRTSATAVSNVNVEGTCYARDGVFPDNLRLLQINRTTAPAIITLRNSSNIARPIRCIRAQ